MMLKIVNFLYGLKKLKN